MYPEPIIGVSSTLYVVSLYDVLLQSSVFDYLSWQSLIHYLLDQRTVSIRNKRPETLQSAALNVP